MAFPSLVGSPTIANRTSNATTHTLVTPDTTESGERLLAIAGWDGDTIGTWPGSWTVLVRATGSGGDNTVEVAYRDIVTGSTSTPNATITTSDSEQFACIVARISGQDPNVPPFISPRNTQSAKEMNCPTIDPPWDTLETMWIATGGWDRGTTNVSSYPTSFINGISSRAATDNGTGVAFCRRQLLAATVDPGNIVLSTSRSHVAFGIAIAPAGAVPTVGDRRVGAVTDDGFTVVGGATAGGSCRLVVSTASDLSAPVFSSAVTADAQGWAEATITGLSPDTLHYYGWEVDGILVDGGRGECRTVRTGAHSFNFAMASCALSGSDAAVFDTIRAAAPAFFVHTGDMHYEDLETVDPAAYRTAWDEVVDNTNQAELYANIPLVYQYSNHDFAGGETSHAGSTGSTVVPTVYRQYFPHYPLVNSTTTEGIYHTFEIGRVRFIVLDDRRYRDPDTDTDDSGKILLGSTQEAWFHDLLLANRGQLKFIFTSGTWGFNSATGDNWGSYQTERTRHTDFFNANNIRNMIWCAGDLHHGGSDDGRNSPGQLPMLQAAPLDQTSNNTTLVEYLNGPYPPNDGGIYNQFGWVQITDAGESLITVTFNVHSDANIARLSPLTMNFDVSPAISVGSLGV
jgi:alkaline phosphatase D